MGCMRVATTPQESIPKAPGTAQCTDGNSPLPAAGSPPANRQMDRGMDGSPQPSAQPQPLQVPATMSGLPEGPWRGLDKARASVAARGRDAERSTAQLLADSSAQMFQQGLSAATGEVEPGTASHDCGGRLGAWAWVHGTRYTAHGARHGCPLPARTQGMATRSPLSAAVWGELGAGVTHTPGEDGSRRCTARVAAGTAPGPSSPGWVPGQTAWPVSQAGIGDGQSQGKSREDANGAGDMRQSKLRAPAPQITAFPIGPPLAQCFPANPTCPAP